jgi:hypothetical protein
MMKSAHPFSRAAESFKAMLCFLLPACWYGFFLFHKINLINADLGRHLKNGEIFLKFFSIPQTNFYSYTFPDFVVVNHHWAGGVFLYLIWKAGGFAGLSIFYGILSLVVFRFFYRVAEKEAGPELAFLAALWVVPLLAERVEIRPEVFSYFFAGCFFTSLWRARLDGFSSSRLWVLPVLEAVWANCHIYFFLGPVIISVFLLEAWQRGQKAVLPRILRLLAAAAAASLLNPHGIKGALAPFTIFQNYGYRVAENQSIPFLQHFVIHSPSLIYFEITFSLLVFSFILLFFRNPRGVSIPLLLLGILFSAMGWLAVRNLTIFGFFVMPMLALNFRKSFSDPPSPFKKAMGTATLAALIFSYALWNQAPVIAAQKRSLGVGLLPGIPASAEFFLRENIEGPILNNYDIGGYLIYYLFDQHRVFVDNRPEAYPASFFREIYVPMQENEVVWQEQEKRWNFNAIFFGYHDQTPWAQEFLIRRLRDPLWAPVFADNFAVIWVRRTIRNQALISRCEVPSSRFSIRRV